MAGLAINPPTDIVLGVANAADPQKVRVAVERLRTASAAGSADFQTLLASSGAAAIPTTIASHAIKAHSHALSAGAQQQDRGKLGSFGKLEAFVLQTFVQAMLPKDAHSFFGKGIAGEFWKSMLAEKLATELAKSGQIGLAKRLAGRMAAGPPSASSPLPAGLSKQGFGAGLATSTAAALAGLQPALKPTLRPTMQPLLKPTGVPMAGGANDMAATSPNPDDRS